MCKNYINGFLIVSDNVIVEPLWNDIVYKGFERDIPKGIINDHYDKLLSSDIENIYNHMEDNYSREIGSEFLT